MAVVHKYETLGLTMCRERETLEHSVLNGMSPSNPLLQSSRNKEKVEAEKLLEDGEKQVSLNQQDMNI